MRIVDRAMITTLAALTLSSGALAAPVETVLYRFTSGRDGANALAGLISEPGRALRHNGNRRNRQRGHSFEADASRQGPDRLDRERALQFQRRQRRCHSRRWPRLLNGGQELQ
jgi:hypothetical protein